MLLENIIIQCRKCKSEDFKIVMLYSGGCGDPDCCGDREYYGITTICQNCKTEQNVYTN